MKQHQMLYISLLLIIQSFTFSDAQLPSDVTAMLELKTNLLFQDPLFWSNPDPCLWQNVKCIKNRVIKIQINNMELNGSLPASLNQLTELQVFEVASNQLTGPLPKFPRSVHILMLNENQFSEIPTDFFQGMTSLETVHLGNNLFNQWTIPETLNDAAGLITFSAIAANVTGTIPSFLGGLENLTTLHLSFNHLEGGLPIEFASSSIQSLWLNSYQNESKLGGPINVLKNMTSLTDVWLQGNKFTGQIPNVSALEKLEDFDISDNLLTGPVPDSLTNLISLQKVNLYNNLFQGKRPLFWSGTIVEDDMNHFCLDTPGIECDRNVNLFLKVSEALNYPIIFAWDWIGNDVCNWDGITCTSLNETDIDLQSNGRNVTEIDFKNKGLAGMIAPEFAQFTSLEKLYLNNNSLTGTIPDVLIQLANLVFLDVSFNDLSGPLPMFRPEVTVKFDGTRIGMLSV